MKILGFIPARKGSKGLKNKNLVKFMGKPLIFHTIDCCKKLKFLTPFVSTDSKEIAEICGPGRYGAEGKAVVGFFRKNQVFFHRLCLIFKVTLHLDFC